MHYSVASIYIIIIYLFLPILKHIEKDQIIE